MTQTRGDAAASAVLVGPFPVADRTRADVVDEIVRMAGTGESRPRTAFALHVGGLVARRDADFVEAMNRADVVYADGASVVLVARAAGAVDIERAPTTDLGWDVLRGLRARDGVAPTVSIVGGRPGIAAAALDRLVKDGVARTGVTDHGYHSDWTATVERLAAVPSDVLVVGMGAPREMTWTMEHLDRLGTGLVLTCGGWLGFLVGEERRAPEVWLRWSMEWAFRLLHDPRRLTRRYARGAVATALLWMRARVRRR